MIGGGVITISEPGGFNPHRVRVGGLTTTIGVRQVGTLTCLLPERDAARYGFARWEGLHVRYDHATQDPWGGEIVDTKPSSAGRTLDLMARSPAWTFAQRRLPATYQPVMGMPGALAKAAIAATATRRHLWVTDIAGDESGRPMPGEARADDLLAYLDYLAQQSGQEWTDGCNDDGSWWWRWQRTAGEDKRDRVWLIENASCTDVDAPTSIQGLVNDLLGIGDDRQYAAAAKVIVTDQDSIAQVWGRREGAIRYAGMTAEGGVQPLAAADVARLSVPAIAPALRMSAHHPLAAEIRPGDIVRLTSGTANAEYAFRPLTISLGDEGRILTLTGTAEAA